MSKKRFLPLLLFVGMAMLIAFAPLPITTPPTERVIRVEAGDYAFTPGVLHANPGDHITLELVSKDVAHGLSIDGYPVDLHTEPGQTTRVSFVAQRAGTFKMRCSIACGNLHPFMTGKFEVGPNLLLYRAIGLALLGLVFGMWQVLR